MDIPSIYEQAYLELERQGGPCPTCRKSPRTHLLHIRVRSDGSLEVRTICRYGADGTLKEVFRKSLMADKDALREAFGNLYLEDRGQRLDDFLAECDKRIAAAERKSREADETASLLLRKLEDFAETLGVPTSDKGKPFGIRYLLKMLGATIKEFQARRKHDQARALSYYDRNRELSDRIRRGADVIRLRTPHENASAASDPDANPDGAERRRNNGQPPIPAIMKR